MSAFVLDAEGDCGECGHQPWLHTPDGCHETIHAADLTPTRCDCSKTLPADLPGPGIVGWSCPHDPTGTSSYACACEDG